MRGDPDNRVRPSLGTEQAAQHALEQLNERTAHEAKAFDAVAGGGRYDGAGGGRRADEQRQRRWPLHAGCASVGPMGHVDFLKLVLLGVTLVAWVLLVVVMIGPPRVRVGGNFGSALAFLLAAGITRLTFTEVETRIQITAFCAVAAVLVARQTVGFAGAARLARWASCAAGTIVGAVVVREIVHHILERLM